MAWIDVLSLVAADLRTGASLINAMEPHPAFRTVLARWRVGIPLVECFEGLATDPDSRLAVGVLHASASVGGASALALDRATETLRERQALVAERRAQSAQARLSAVMMSLLAPAFAVWTMIADAEVRHVLLATPVGAVCLLVGGVLNLCGWTWMRHLVRGAS